MKAMKNFLTVCFLFMILGITLLYHEDIAIYIIDNFIYRRNIIIVESDIYKRQHDFEFIQKTDNFYPKNRQDIYNIFYTILNNGWDDFSFFCDKEYKSCVADVNEITSNSFLLSSINNYVSPYHSFDKISVITNNYGKIDVNIDYMYSKYQINLINNKLDYIIKEIITENMSETDKIKAFHDYVINNTKYDTERANIISSGLDDSNPLYQSHIAYGPLIEGQAICGGYSDAMALFLDKFNIKNYKIATDDHVWNYVLIDGNWYHIDLTWDDPVLSDGKEILMHNFFMITTKQLEDIKTGEHEYLKEIYLEAK